MRARKGATPIASPQEEEQDKTDASRHVSFTEELDLEK